MSTTIVPITKYNLELVSRAGAKWGMPRSVGWLRRCLFDPTVEDLTDDEVRGHMSVTENGDVVAIQSYYYIPGYYKQKKILINTGCIMGADAKYGEELLCLLDKNQETRKLGQVSIGNCIANKRSAKICKVYHRMKEAPPEAKQMYIGVSDWSLYPIHIIRKNLRLPLSIQKATWYITRPVSWVRNAGIRLVEKISCYNIVQYRKIDIEKFGGFWRKFLAENDGVVTSREPKRLAWMFDDSLAAGIVKIIAAEKNGEIVGYALFRRYLRKEGFFNNHSLYDICALHNDATVLRLLVRAAKRLAGDDKGCLIMYVGALPKQDQWLLPFLPKCVKDDHSMIFYRSSNAEILQSIEQAKGWFLGPMDGERCLGHGASIDL